MTEDAGPSIERFRDGWVLVDRAGTISTPTPMTEEAARAYAALLGIDFPAEGMALVRPSYPLGRRYPVLPLLRGCR